MANALFNPGREGFLAGEIDWDTAVIKSVLVRGYAFVAGHRFVSELTGAGATLIATVTLVGKGITNGVADANDLLFTLVPAGAAIPALVIYQASAVTGGADVPAAQQRLIGFIDTAIGLPVSPNGNDVSVVFDDGPNKIFVL